MSAAPANTSANIRSWGGLQGAVNHLQAPAFSHELGAALRVPSDPKLVIGNLRSYGDEVLNPHGQYIQTTRCDRMLHFDEQNGILQVEAGAQIAALQNILGPKGWMFPVTPGTALLTIGGAIANDVHGKNHHAAGTFGHHVLSFVLLRTSGETLVCSPQENADWFAATLGGMGLTGAIQQATLQLRRIPHSQLHVKNWRFDNLDEFFTLDAEHTPQHEYSVAWVDCVASGAQLGRGIFSVADHLPAKVEKIAEATSEGVTLLKAKKRAVRRSVPISPPFSCINQLSLRAFNTLYFHRPFPLSLPAVQQASMYQWLYPLDSILHWNRLYGRAGFVQFQCAIPPQSARVAVKDMLQTIAQSGQGSFLAVLKNFGEQASLGMLSFPQPGTTLALDFPWLGERTATLLARLHAINLAAGGRIYAAKDSHAPAHALVQGYPRFAEFQRYLDPGLASVMGQRFNLGK